jgi:hypothetical protein
MTTRVVRAVDFLGITAWWGASFFAAGVIADGEASLWLRIGLALALWGAALAIPSWILRRQRRLDEMQQLILMQSIAGAGLFALSYLVGMAAYFSITKGDAAVGLMTLTAMAPPMAMMFAAFIAALRERAAERDEDWA